MDSLLHFSKGPPFVGAPALFYCPMSLKRIVEPYWVFKTQVPEMLPVGRVKCGLFGIQHRVAPLNEPARKPTLVVLGFPGAPPNLLLALEILEFGRPSFIAWLWVQYVLACFFFSVSLFPLASCRLCPLPSGPFSGAKTVP